MEQYITRVEQLKKGLTAAPQPVARPSRELSVVELSTMPAGVGLYVGALAKGIQRLKEASALDQELRLMAVGDPAQPHKTTAAVNAYMQAMEYFAHHRKCARLSKRPDEPAP